MTRLAIDPVTRIGGHLRLEVDVRDGVVADAWSSGTMFRGIELVLQGRDPRDAWLFAHRVCGACTGAQALASVRAVENAFIVRIPPNARLIRDLLAGAAFAQGHVMQFYTQHLLDWVDVMAAIDADPAATSTLARTLSDWPDSSAVHFTEVRDRLAALVESGQSGIFANGYWGHPAYRLDPEADLLFMAHYFDALEWQRNVSRLTTLLGGKNPHPQTFVLGGMVLWPPWGGPVQSETGQHPVLPERNAPVALSEDGLNELNELTADIRRFIDQVYVPDVMAIAGFYEDWLGVGAGTGNYLSYGDFPEGDTADARLLVPRGRLSGGRLTQLQPVDHAAVAETVAHSWYAQDADAPAFRHPLDGETRPKYSGPKLPFSSLEGSEQYSYLKAPRYEEEPQEVGPLARVLVAYAAGRTEFVVPVTDYVSRLGMGADALSGTLGRMVARAIEAQVIALRLGPWLADLRANLATGDVAVADITRWDPGSWPSEAEGHSLGESPKGALGHWVRIKDGHIEAYQIVDATTWNASPRDDKGLRGAMEEALIGTPVVDLAKPVEILRTVHAFDPCTACAVHARGLAAGSLDVRLADGGPR